MIENKIKFCSLTSKIDKIKFYKTIVKIHFVIFLLLRLIENIINRLKSILYIKKLIFDYVIILIKSIMTFKKILVAIMQSIRYNKIMNKISKML